MGAGLVALVACGGLYLSARPNSTRLDQWLFDLVPSGTDGYLTRITWLRYPAVVVAVSVVLALVVVRRDRARALACLVAPPLALLSSELVIKPAVGRTLGGVLSYPSGSTVGAAALATAAVLVVPMRWRVAATVAASVYALWMAVAVVALRWHFPTDALAGLAYGTGFVLVVDGLVWWALRPLRRRHQPSG